MATFEAARNKYVSDSVPTMSPGHLIVALYDRVLLDLERAGRGREDADMFATHTALTHAQEIVHELLTSLDVKQWPGGEHSRPSTAGCRALLSTRNVRKDRRPCSSAERCSFRYATRGAKPPGSSPRETHRDREHDRIVGLAHRARPVRRRSHRHRGSIGEGLREPERAGAGAPSRVPRRADAAELGPRAEELLARTRRPRGLRHRGGRGASGRHLRSLAGHRPQPPDPHRSHRRFRRVILGALRPPALYRP